MEAATDVTLRAARPEDGARIAELFVDLDVDDPPPSQERFEQEMLSGTLVAEREGRVVGYVYTETLEDTGYVRQVVTDASERRRGVGRALLGAWARRFREAGCTAWCLNVKPGNVSARGLYESLGMHPAFRSYSLRFPWELLAGVPAGDIVLEQVLSRAQEREAEATFSLPAGLVAQKRSLPGWVILAAREAGALVGLACFNPSFPGAYPFRAKNLAAAKVLLDGCALHALPNTPYMQAVLEDQEALAQQMLEAGATLRLDILHYRGPLG